MKIIHSLGLVAVLLIEGCSKTSAPSPDFFHAELRGYMDKVGYKDLHLTVQQFVDYSSDAEARHWTRLSDTDWSLTLDVPNSDKLVMAFSAVPELKGDVLLKSVKGKETNLEGFGILTFVAMLQADQKNRFPDTALKPSVVAPSILTKK